MSDLISRSALYEKAAKLEEDARTRYFDTPPESPARQVHMAELTGITSVKHMIYDAPAVDAVPVVRCKDCCHAVVVRNKGVVMYIGCGYFPNNILTKDFYCANGEAKMDGGDADV